MLKDKKIKVILGILFFIILSISPSHVNAAKVSVGKVKGVKVKSQDTTSIKISWNSVSKATGYKVYICDNSNNKYKYYGKTSSKSMTIKKLTSSKQYKIKIRGYRTVKKKNYYGSYSSIITTVTKPTQVKNLTAKSQTDTTINLTWDKVSRASGYRVYEYNSSKKNYEYYGQTSTNSITVKKLKSAEQYKFKVRAYKTLKNTKYYGSYSSVLTTATKTEPVKNLTIKSKGDDSVNISWDKVTRASGYRIYIADSSNEYKYYGQTTSVSKGIQNLKLTQIYQIRVRAYKEVNKTKYYGSYSNVVKLATKPSKVTGLESSSQTENSITIKWNKVDNAEGYNIYVYSQSSQSYKQKATTENTSYKITGLDTAKFYKIYIKTYTTINGVKYYSEQSEILSQKTKSTDTIKAGIDVSKHQGKIEWDKVKDKGIDFAILRLGWIGNKNNHTLDTRFEENYKECKRLGIPVGVYVYTYTETTEKAEEGANWAAEQLKKYNVILDYPIYIDMEDEQISGLEKKTLTSISEKFCETMIKQGYEPGIYANKYWLETHLDGEALKKKYSIWLAHYTDNTSYTGYEIWQYSDSGQINGIDESVDLNIMIIYKKD